SFGFSHYSGRVMAADIEEAPQNIVVSPHHNNRFAGNFSGNVLSRLLQLIHASDELPRTREDSLSLQFTDAFVRVPRRWNGPRVFEWRIRIVAIDDVAKGWFHEL